MEKVELIEWRGAGYESKEHSALVCSFTGIDF